MGKSILENFRKISAMGKESSNGRMEENMMENGAKASNMALEFIPTIKVKKEKESGRMANGSSG